MSSLRILMHCHDAMGLGHTSRSLFIASHLSERIENCTILMLTDLSIVGKFKLPANVDYVHLPGIMYSGQDEYRSKNLNIRAKKTLRIRCKVAQSAAKTFKPKVMMIDRDPSKLPKEMKRNLAFMREVLPKTRLVWSLPDILGDPEAIMEDWNQGKIYKMLHHFSDEIWIYGAKQIFDAIHEYQFPETLKAKTIYAGYLKSPQISLYQKATDLNRFNIEKPFILVTAGSGVDGSSLVDTYLAYLEKSNGKMPYHSVIITGPMMSSRDKKAFMQRAMHLPNVIFHRFSKHILQYIRYADLVLTTGGFNTFCEILSFRKKTIMVPNLAPPMEHFLRANIFSKLGLVQLLHPDQLSTEALANLIESTLASKPHRAKDRGRSQVPMDGLDQIVERLKALSVKAKFSQFD